MTTRRRIFCSCVFLIGSISSGIFCGAAEAQTSAPLPQSTAAGASSTADPQQSTAAPASISTFATPQKRVMQAVDDKVRVTLRGNVHPLATSTNDKGAAPDSLAMERMMLVLQRSPQQEQALQQLLEGQQARNSANFHQWLTPEQFGAQFGVHDDDIAAVSNWLGSHGFRVTKVSASKMFVEFSGTAAQVRDAFATEIHQFNVNGEDHWANTSEPQVPAALAPVIAGVHSLNSFRAKAMNHVVGTFTRSSQTGKLTPTGAMTPSGPNFTFTCGFDSITDQFISCYGITPYDFATIYNELPLWNAAQPIDGTGQTIAIVARTNIDPQDVTDFRSVFGLPANPVQVILDGPDPGLVPGDETEADLDMEWSGAVARGATIDVVVSESTETTDGVDLSALYIVDNNIAPVMSESYGLCELFMGSAWNQFYNTLWQQAAAQGISVFVSSGDQGSAGCDFNQGFVPQPAVEGLQVSGFASTPNNVAVGGTDFIEAFNGATYWNTTNDPKTQASAKGYIPETTWNDSCTNGIWSQVGFSPNPETNCNNSQLADTVLTVGGSGGQSRCTTPTGTTPQTCHGGYAKPAWQAAPGVASDGTRDLPDVSLFASNGFQGSFYMVCEQDAAGPCSTSSYVGLGGTSASSPAFAGILALVNQQTGSRQGNPNYVLYSLAAQQSAYPASCNSTVGSAGNCIFNDVTNGTIAMACSQGSPECTVSLLGDTFGILSGYSTGAGYDLATGLGSVNVANLVNNWTSGKRATSQTTLTLNNGNPVNITHGATVPVAISVGPSSPEPTGLVSLIATPNGGGMLGGLGSFTLSNGNASGTTNELPGGASYSVTAHYGGDNNYLGGDSAAVTVTVNPEPSLTSIHTETVDMNTFEITSTNASSVPYGSLFLIRADVTNGSGTDCFDPSNKVVTYACPTGSVGITDNSAALGSGTFVLNSTGYTEDQFPQLPAGSHSLAGQYSGDGSYKTSPGSEALTVSPAATITSLPNGSALQTLVAGQPMTLDLTTRSLNVMAYGANLTGGFTLLEDGKPIATTPLSTLTGYICPNTQCVYEYLTLDIYSQINLVGPPGTHTLTLTYNGDGNYAPSTGAQSYHIAYGTQTAVSSSAATITFGQNVTYTATVTPSLNAGANPTGTVAFVIGGTTFPAVSLNGGQAQLTTNTTPGGLNTVVANYSGDSNYYTSQGQIAEAVNPANTTLTLSSSSSTVAENTNVTFTAQVAGGGNGVPQPSGSATFYANGNMVGSAVVSSGQGQFTTQFNSTGSFQVQAVYSGNLDYATSSNTVTETVTPPPPDFSLSAVSPVVVNAPGQGTTSTVTVSSTTGFAGTISLSCSVAGFGVTVMPQCGFAANPLMLSSTVTSASSTLNISTTGNSLAIPRLRGPGHPRKIMSPWIFALAVLFLLVFLAARGRHAEAELQGSKHVRLAGMLVLVAAFCLALQGCGAGSGNGGNGGGGNQNAGTTPGLYTVTVTATSGNTTHMVQVQVNVE